MPLLEIRLLGDFQLRSRGDPVPAPATLKAQSLLAYLVVHRDRPSHREALAERFWPERPPERALHSLSTALWHIRRVLPAAGFLLSDPHTVQFDAGSDFWLDSAVFRDLVERGRADELPADEVARLIEAVALYRGDFLEHFYDDWCLEERYALEALYLNTLGDLLVLHETLGRPEEALAAARRLLARDPLREDVQRSAIRLLFDLGRRSEALREARHFRDLLQAELGVGPQPETLALCTSLFGREWSHAVAVDLLPEPAPPRPRRLALLERPPFVGREAEWRQLLARWREACSGRGHFVVLSGEAGIGKSRLAEELLAHVQQHGGGAALAHCYEHERALPYGPLVDLLRTLGTADSVHELPRWQAIELTYLLPEINASVTLERQTSAGSRTPPRSDPQQQARLFDAVNFLFLHLARRRPLLLIVEDLHWASDSTLAWLHSLSRRLDGVGLLLVGSWRCEDIPSAHPLQRLYLNLGRAGVASRLELGRLAPEALSAWFADPPLAFTAQLYAQTEGNPFFALETLRALEEAGLVTITPDHQLEVGGPAPLPIPESVRETIRLRLAQLSPRTRECAEIAAVIGRTFALEILQRAWERTEEAVLEPLDELLRRRLIRESDPPKGSDYEFDHHLIREVVYNDLHYRRRRRWHRAVATELESGPAELADAAHIGYHFDAGAEPRRALAYYEQAAREAQAQFAWQEAETHLARVLALLDELSSEDSADARRRARILAVRAEHLDNLGRVDERESDIAAVEALALSGDPVVRLLALVQRTRTLNYEGHYREALGMAEDGLALARSQGDAEGEYRFLTYIASSHYFLGRPRRALEALEGARRILDAEEEACGRLRARLHQFLGYTHFHLAEWRRSLQHHQQAHQCSLALGDHLRAVWNSLDAAYLQLKLGCAEEARRGMTEGLALARELRLPAAEGYALLLLGEVALHRGTYLTARELFEQALPLHEAAHSEHNSLATRELLGWIHYHSGDLTAARKLFEEAADAGERIGHRRLRVASLIGLGLVLDAQREFSLAHHHLQEAVRVARESECVENLLKGLCAMARVARGQGETRAALEHAGEVLTLVRDRPMPTVQMWACLEAALAHAARDDAEAATPHVVRALELLPEAHAAWIQPQEVRAAHAHIVGRAPAP